MEERKNEQGRFHLGWPLRGSPSL
ncbi:hypothetical protein TNCV_4095921, partial [Trichonephila clavipes]